MKTEKEKMLSGELYDAGDPELCQERHHARALTTELNATRDEDRDTRREIIGRLMGSVGEWVGIQPPFYCDYGYNIHLGSGVHFNFNCVILDVMRVDIGNNCLFGPAVQIYTATHPLGAVARRTGLEGAKPVRIGDDVWVGGGAIILPGITIGARSVIGAGSVVTKDVPEGVFAAGNPCKVIRILEEHESD